MPLAYDITGTSYLRQGDIITEIIELQPLLPNTGSANLEDVKTVNRIQHPYSIVISQDCDLKYDFEARNGVAEEHKLLKHVVLCDLYTETEIHSRSGINADIRRKIKSNQDERYHYFIEAPINGTTTRIPVLWADYKNTFSLPSEWIYWQINKQIAKRIATVTTPYMQEFMHRQYNFLSRIATPP